MTPTASERPVDLDELESSIGSEYDGELHLSEMTALALIQEAREYRRLVGALDYLGGCAGVTLVTPHYQADIDAENCIEAALQLGWTEDQGRTP